VSMIKFVGTNAVPKLDHGRAWFMRPDGAGKTLTQIAQKLVVIATSDTLCTAVGGWAPTVTRVDVLY
jgi:hypothetical protein